MRRGLLAATAIMAMAGRAHAAVPCDLAKQSAAQSWIDECDAAIRAATDPKTKSTRLYQRAYVAIDQHQFDLALDLLNQSIALWPDNEPARHERAYTLGEFGHHGEALADLDHIVIIAADPVDYRKERAWSRRMAGDIAGALADYDWYLARVSDEADMYGEHAIALLYAGRDTDAETEWAKARAMAEKQGKAALVKDMQRALDDLALMRQATPAGDSAQLCRRAMMTGDMNQPNLVGDCSAAFKAARTGTDKAEFLTIRATAMMIIRQDPEAGLLDCQMAVAFDPANADWHSNLGSRYTNSRHSWAGRNEFNIALKLKTDQYSALAGRASANFNLRDYDSARRDAVASAKIKVNSGAMVVLGDLASHIDKDPEKARYYWLSAWKLGFHDDSLRQQLAAQGIDNPDEATLESVTPKL